ncbi:pyroglutamyl-peptidase I [Enterococcus olivae]
MKILVTGFDPFAGEKINPAWEAVKLLPAQIQGAEIIKQEVPTVFGRSAEVTNQAILEYLPDVVLAIGQAGGRSAITPERIAINIDDARIPDNEGNQPIDTPIQKEGQAAYFTQLPVKAMVQAIKDIGLPATLSNTAGTFVCNHLMYQVQYLIEKEFPKMKGGFIHVPFASPQVIDTDQFSLQLSEITAGLTKAIEAIVLFDQKNDLQTIEGTIH